MEENNKNPVKQYIDDLENKVKSGGATAEDFKNAFAELQRAKLKIQQLLEYKTLDNNDINNSYYSLYKKISGENFSDLVDKLHEIGRKNPNKGLKEAFKKQSYRLLRQIRTGNRDKVFYDFLRIFISSDEKFDNALVSAFKYPEDESFKVLIYSYLSGIIQ